MYAGPSLNLAPHSGSVWCFAVGIDGPLTVTTPDGATREGTSVLIPPRLTHQLICLGRGLVSCYLEPTSARAEACRHKMSVMAAARSESATRPKQRLMFTPTDDESACALARFGARRAAQTAVDPRIAAAARRIREDPATAVLVARARRRGGAVRVAVPAPVPRRAGHEPAALPDLGAARARGHGHRRRRQHDRGGDEVRLREPVAPRRPVQDHLRAVG